MKTNANSGEIEQLNLLNDKNTENTLHTNNSISAFSDPAFAKNKTLPIHR